MNIWDKYSYNYHKASLASKPNFEKYGTVARFIIKYKFNNVLDLGCGSGILENTLNELKYKGKVIAVDGSNKMLEIARNNDCSTNYVHEDIDTFLRNHAESYDCVVMINSLFLLPSVEKTISLISTKLNIDGYFILINPKPRGYIKELVIHNFTGSLRDKKNTLITIIRNMYHIVKTLILQKHIDNEEKRGLFTYATKEATIEQLKKTNLRIISVDEIQARQNWMYLMQK